MPDDLPQDLGDLSPERLVEAGKYLALSVLAQPALFMKGAEQVGTEALTLLAERSNDPDVFASTWMVLRATVKPRDEDLRRWKVTSESLAMDLVVPEHLRTEISDFIKAAGPPQRDRQGRPNPAQHWKHQLAVSILTNLADDSDWAVALAKSILEDVEVSDQRWDAAAKVLARRGTPTALNALLSSVDGNQPIIQLRALSRVPTHKRRKKDAERIAELLSEQRLDDAQFVGELILDLPTDIAARVLAAPAIAKSGDDYLLELNLARGNDDTVKSLVSSEDIPDNVRRSIVWSTENYGLDRASTLGPWLFARNPGWGEKLAAGALNQAARQGGNEEQKARWKETAARIGVAGRNESIAVALGKVLRPGEILALTSTKPRNWEQVGAILRCLQDYGEADGEEEIAAVLKEVPKSARLEVARGVLGQERTALEPPAVKALSAWALKHPELQPLLVDHEMEDALVAAAIASRGQAVVAVLQSVGPRLEDTSWPPLADAATWQDFTESKSYATYVSLLEEHPNLLLDEAERALKSLLGPEQEWIQRPLLLEILSGIRRGGLASKLTTNAVEALDRVLRSGHKASVERACSLMAERSPTPRDVEILQQAHEMTTRWPDMFARAREAQARQLMKDAEDTSAEVEARIESLTACAAADATVGREAAFSLIESQDADIRLAAAEVIRQVAPDNDELDRIRTLADEEPDRRVQAELHAAIRRAESGDIGEAFRNLYELADLDPEEAPDPQGLNVPEPLHGQLISAIDKARSSSAGAAHDFATSTSALVDLLAEIAAGVAGRAGLVRMQKSEINELLTNGDAKPDAGALLRRQSLHDTFDWFGDARAAHERRATHAGRKGSTEPHVFGPDHEESLVTRSLLRRVVEGFVESLIDAKRAT